MSQMRIGKDIKALSNEITRYVRANLNSETDDQYTMIQFFFLSYINQFSPTKSVFQRDLEHEFNIRRSTATGILQVLEKNNLIQRRTSQTDARLKEIVLTAAGEAVFMERHLKLDAINQHLIKDISQDHLETFYAVMDQIYFNICDEEGVLKPC